MWAGPAVGAGAGMAAPVRTTHTHAQRSACVRVTSACKLSADTDKTRANEEQKFWRREAEEGAMHCTEKNVPHAQKQDSTRQCRTKKRGGSTDKGPHRGIAMQSSTCKCRGCRRGSRRSQSGARIVGRASLCYTDTCGCLLERGTCHGARRIPRGTFPIAPIRSRQALAALQPRRLLPPPSMRPSASCCTWQAAADKKCVARCDRRDDPTEER